MLHQRDGSPEWAALVCDLPDGSRCYARMDSEAELAAAETDDLIGQSVQLRANDESVNRATL